MSFINNDLEQKISGVQIEMVYDYGLTVNHFGLFWALMVYGQKICLMRQHRCFVVMIVMIITLLCHRNTITITNMLPEAH